MAESTSMTLSELQKKYPDIDVALKVSEHRCIKRWRIARDSTERGMPVDPEVGDAFLDLSQCHQYGVVRIYGDDGIWLTAPLPTFVTGRDHNEALEEKSDDEDFQTR